MNAIRVLKRGRGTRYTAHWLVALADGYDPDRTGCGRTVSDLQVVERLHLDVLPAVEACRGCIRFAEGWDKPRSPTATRITSEPRGGRLRTTGSLHHGFNRRKGRRTG